MRALILGGTGPAREVARLLQVEGWEVVSSLAGRVKNPALPVGQVRIGGFGGAAGLAQWLIAHSIDLIVDATHPYAERISFSAAHASESTGIPLIALHRRAWSPEPGDEWIHVQDMTTAAERATTEFTRIFLTIGRQQLAPFAQLDHGNFYLIRTVDEPEVPVPHNHVLLKSRGPFSVAGDLELIRRYDIDCLVTKNSGGEMTKAKLQAARTAHIPVIMVDRPPLPRVPYEAQTAEDVLDIVTGNVAK